MLTDEGFFTAPEPNSFVGPDTRAHCSVEMPTTLPNRPAENELGRSLERYRAMTPEQISRFLKTIEQERNRYVAACIVHAVRTGSRIVARLIGAAARQASAAWHRHGRPMR